MVCVDGVASLICPSSFRSSSSSSSSDTAHSRQSVFLHYPHAISLSLSTPHRTFTKSGSTLLLVGFLIANQQITSAVFHYGFHGCVHEDSCRNEMFIVGCWRFGKTCWLHLQGRSDPRISSCFSSCESALQMKYLKIRTVFSERGAGGIIFHRRRAG